MKILILGGNGYLGSKLVHKLLKDGDKCSIICTQRVGTVNKRLEDISDRIRIIPSSIDAICTLLQYEQIDVVLNLVCNYSRSNLLYDSVIEANIEFPLNVLNLITEQGVKRFITIGTSLPAKLNMYSFSKKMLSEFGKYYTEKHNISFTDIRLEMFYGSDEPNDRFIPMLISNMLVGKPVDVTIGTQKRDIIAIEDVVKALEVIINTDLPGYIEIPVGTGVAPTISEITDYIWELTGRKSVINKGAVPMRTNEPDCIANLTLLRELCDWQPVGWQEGLKHMILTMKKELEKQ
ncbi:MAG: NAD(P)-dependent oxidoreductase [Ruminococcus sp.]|nr:NAD(P)-dependent oxidoreductase [Ruminococcus sp.]